MIGDMIESDIVKRDGPLLQKRIKNIKTLQEVRNERNNQKH